MDNNSDNNYTITEANNLINQYFLERAFWIRSYVGSSIDNNSDVSVVFEKCIQNSSTIADIIRNIYKAEVADHFEFILKEYFVLIGELITNMKKNDDALIQDTIKSLDANADAFAFLLSNINPYLHNQEIANLRYELVQFTTELISKRISKQYPEEMNVFELLKKNLIRTAEVIIVGINKQIYHTTSFHYWKM